MKNVVSLEDMEKRRQPAMHFSFTFLSERGGCRIGRAFVLGEALVLDEGARCLGGEGEEERAKKGRARVKKKKKKAEKRRRKKTRTN